MVRINFSMLDILIVENNLFEQSVMQTMLRAFGARQVRAARNGKLAIRSVLSRAPDIILLDREIGEPSGLDVARFIRLASKSPDNFLPMIMVTSHAEQCQVVEARDAGINAVIVKPLASDALPSRFESDRGATTIRSYKKLFRPRSAELHLRSIYR